MDCSCSLAARRLPWAGISVGEGELAARIAQVLESQDVCRERTHGSSGGHHGRMERQEKFWQPVKIACAFFSDMAVQGFPFHMTE